MKKGMSVSLSVTMKDGDNLISTVTQLIEACAKVETIEKIDSINVSTYENIDNGGF
jgi:hypothetical protein